MPNQRILAKAIFARNLVRSDLGSGVWSWQSYASLHGAEGGRMSVFVPDASHSKAQASAA
jgi:hypothetical protein